MFDFFKYMKDELSGIDTETAYKEIREKAERERESKYIFSRKAKVTTILMSVIYILTALVSLSILKGSGNYLYIIKSIIMALLALGVIISLAVNKKKGEIVAVVGIAIFVVCLLFSVAFL